MEQRAYFVLVTRPEEAVRMAYWRSQVARLAAQQAQSAFCPWFCGELRTFALTDIGLRGCEGGL